MSDDARLEMTVKHQRYVPYSSGHYGGGLVDGAYILGLFGDVATELCIRADGDEGLLASYSNVQLLAPVRAGDVLEVSATLTGVGSRSRKVRFSAHVTCRSAPARSASAADVLVEPLLVASADGTVVVP